MKKNVVAHYVCLSGSGWLFPFHIGALRQWMRMGLIKEGTRFIGASGGAMVAAAFASKVKDEKITELALEICAQARKYGLWRMGSIIEAALDEHLPEDAIAVTRGRLQVAVMRIWPRPSRHPELCSQFQERDELINCIMASSHIPFYLEPALSRRFRDGQYIDGGIIDVMPPCPDQGFGLKSFPVNGLPACSARLDIHREALAAPAVGSVPARWSWLPPPTDRDVLELMALGEKEAASALDHCDLLQNSSQN
jgi:hypothetical protein